MSEAIKITKIEERDYNNNEYIDSEDKLDHDEYMSYGT
jgi:hypothetical protein